MISVLYVDDERDLCELGKLFLEQTGEFQVDTCTSAKEALASDRFSGYDAIIADYHMPEMDGIAFLQAVRAQYGDLPFILFTGRGREDVVIAAINHGVDFYIQKGGDPTAQFAELAHKIRIAVERRQAKEALSESKQRLNDIINFLPDATFVIDRSGTVIAWNRAIEEMTSVTAANMLGKGDYEYAIPFYGARRKILIDLIFESDEIIATRYAHIVHEKDRLIAETSLPRPKGEPKILMGTASPLYNRQGEIVGAIEAIRDITSLRMAEEDAVHTRKDWETIFRAIGHPVIILDTENYILDANDATVRASGMSLEQLKKKHCYEVFHGTGTDRPPASCPLELLRSTGSTGPTEAEIEALGGIYHINCTPVFDVEGRLEKVIHIAMDITERQKAQDDIKAAYEQIATSEEKLQSQYDALVVSEQNLRESEAKYRELADLLPQVVYEMNPQLQITYANRHALATFGVTGQDIESGVSALRFISPSDHGRIRQNIEKLIRGEPFDDHEYMAIRHDGTTFPVLIYSAPIFRSGTLAGFRGVVIDITEHRALEEEFQEQHRQLENLMQNLPAGVFRTTVSAPVKRIMANPILAQIFGYDSVGEFMASSLEESYADPDARRTVIDRLNREGVVSNVEVRMKKKNGEPVWISMSAVVVPGPDGSPEYLDGILTEITARKKAEEALNEANQKLKLLNSITRHDIRNQLSALKGFVEVASVKTTSPALSEYLDKIQSIAETITSQIEFTRAYQELGINVPVWLRLDDVIKNTATLVPVTYSDTCGGTEIFADPMLEQVFFNLFENAVRHGQKVTAISIRCKPEQDNFRIIVEDDGIGIPAENKEKIFRRGFGKNTGLGLFLAKEILSITGISIRETGTVGEGARFEMVVPKGAFRIIT